MSDYSQEVLVGQTTKLNVAEVLESSADRPFRAWALNQTDVSGGPTWTDTAPTQTIASGDSVGPFDVVEGYDSENSAYVYTITVPSSAPMGRYDVYFRAENMPGLHRFLYWGITLKQFSTEPPPDGGDGGSGDGGNGGTALGLGFHDLTATSYTLVLPAIPSSATSISLKFRKKTDSTWTTATAPAAGSSASERPITGAQAETIYVWLLSWTNSGQTTNLTGEIETLAESSGGSGGGTKPTAPAPPTVSKNCVGGGVVVTDSAWGSSDSTHELRRRLTSGSLASYQTIHTWNQAGGTYTDSAVEAATGYVYSVRASNAQSGSDALFSSWSADSASIALQSDTLTLTWITPVAGASLSNRAALRFSLADTGETIVEGSTQLPLNAALALRLDGLSIPLDGLVRVSGSKRNGTYELLWDSRVYANGPRTLKLTAKGSDGCPAQAVRAITLNNTLRQGVLYAEPLLNNVAPKGRQYVQAALALQNEPLSPSPLRRYWVRSGVTSQPDALVDWGSNALAPAEKAAAFNKLPHVTLGQGQVGTTPDRTQYSAFCELAPAGPQVAWVQQWTPTQALSAYETGCQRVEAIIPERAQTDGSQNYLVFARNTNGSGAKVWLLAGEVWSLLANLAEAPYLAPDAVSVARTNNFLYVVRAEGSTNAPNGEIFGIDPDDGEATENLAPRGQARAPRLALRCGEVMANAPLVWLFTKASLSEARTQAYTYEPGRMVPTWVLVDVVTLAGYHGLKALFACGAKLYVSDDGTEEPELAQTFAADITALGAIISDEGSSPYSYDLLIGLSNGQIWRAPASTATTATWTLLLTVASAARAVSGWNPEESGSLAVVGRDSTRLSEQMANGGWRDDRVLTPPSNVSGAVARVTALQFFMRVLNPASGMPGQPGYIPAEIERKLLIGTGDSGLLLVVELAPPSVRLGTLLASRVSHLSVDGITSVIPV